MRIAVTTPTGNIGRVLTEKLLETDHEIVLLARNPDKVADFVARGASTVTGSLDDADYVREATRGANVLFWLIPPDVGVENLREYQNAIGEVGVSAAKQNGIDRVVNLSSLFAHLEEDTGPILGLHDAERKFNATVPNVTHLRPGFFMENHLAALETIASAKSIFFPISPETEGVFIATRDIADFAARRVLDESWSGQHAIELFGPAEITFQEAAEAISGALGETITHVPVSLEQTRDALMGMGASADAAARMCQLYESLEAGKLQRTQEPRSETRGPTSFADFAQSVIAPLVQGAARAR